MAGTKEGGKKAAMKNIEKNPNHYKEAGAKGGKVKVPKGFAAMSPEKRAAAGAKGGAKSRRTKINVETTNERNKRVKITVDKKDGMEYEVFND